MLPLAAAATAITLSRLITRSAIRIVLIAATMLAPAVPRRLPSSSGSSSCTAIQNSSTPPISFSYGSCSSSTRDDGQHDPHHDRSAAAPDDGLLLLLRRQRARGQRDHHRVVAGQHDVDADDLAEPDPELGTVEGHSPAPCSVIRARDTPA